MKNKPEPKAGIMQSPPYVAGSHSIEGFDTVDVLSANENPLGFSDKVVPAIKDLSFNRYPDGGSSDLRNAIAKVHGLNADNIVCGNGSDELLQLLVHSYAGAGDEVLFTEYSFLIYKIATLTAGATPVEVAEVDYTVNVDNILAGITDKTKIIMLANPANPTGTMLPNSEIVRLIENTPKNILIVVDCAYAEYCESGDYGNPAELAEKFDNVVMTRTFSKIYGMAGFRLGWCYGSGEIVDVLNRVRGVFNISSLSQSAGVEAVNDTEFVKKSVAHNSTWLTTLTDLFRQKGFVVPDSNTNFIMVDFGDKELAHKFYKHLKSNGIIVRGLVGYKLPNALRITIGSEKENKRLIEAISGFEF